MPKTLSEILLLEPGGEIRIGDGAPGINFTGIRIYKTMAGFGFETYKEDVLQVYIDPNGTLRSGDGSVYLDATGFHRTIVDGLKGLSPNSIVLTNNDCITSPAFLDGFTGGGVKLWKTSTGWKLTIDNLEVRGNMRVSQLLFMTKRTFNGSLLIGRTGTGLATKFEKLR